MSEAGENKRGETEKRGGLPLDALYREHFTELSRYVLRNFGGGPPDPEDIAQQAFIKMSAFGATIDNIRSFLRRTARNLVIDHHRATVRASRLLADMSIADGSTADFSPEDVLSSKQELAAVNGAIATLPPKERVAFLMHRVDGSSFADIAAYLGVSQSGARHLVKSAMERCLYALEKRS